MSSASAPRPARRASRMMDEASICARPRGHAKSRQGTGHESPGTASIRELCLGALCLARVGRVQTVAGDGHKRGPDQPAFRRLVTPSCGVFTVG